MDDLISRQAVKEILAKYHLGESKIAEELNELPSVQRTSNANKKHIENTLEDAISREDVLDEINRIGVKAFETYNDYSELFDFVDSLPSVSTEKTGRWIDEGFYAEGHSERAYRCSECDEHYIGYVGEFKYCPNCGAKMGEDGDKD